MSAQKVPITTSHLKTMREKYDCSGMSNNQITEALVMYDKQRGNGSVNLLDYLCFPNFQCVLNHFKINK